MTLLMLMLVSGSVVMIVVHVNDTVNVNVGLWLGGNDSDGGRRSNTGGGSGNGCSSSSVSNVEKQEQICLELVQSKNAQFLTFIIHKTAEFIAAAISSLFCSYFIIWTIGIFYAKYGLIANK